MASCATTLNVHAVPVICSLLTRTLLRAHIDHHSRRLARRYEIPRWRTSVEDWWEVYWKITCICGISIISRRLLFDLALYFQLISYITLISTLNLLQKIYIPAYLSIM